jgi:hypothetical protein
MVYSLRDSLSRATIGKVHHMANNEKTGKDVGSLASKALRDPGSVTKSQIKTIAASALTQRPDHRPSKPSRKRK